MRLLTIDAEHLAACRQNTLRVFHAYAQIAHRLQRSILCRTHRGGVSHLLSSHLIHSWRVDAKGMAYEGIADSEGIICVRGRILSWSVYKDHCMDFDMSMSTRI